jgi:hypothetical protein
LKTEIKSTGQKFKPFTVEITVESALEREALTLALLHYADKHATRFGQDVITALTAAGTEIRGTR